MLGQFEELSRGTEAPLKRLERLVHPWSSYLMMPVFAFANAGLALSGAVVGEAAASPMTLGIVTGLVVGKPVGVVGFAGLAVRLRLAALPSGVRWSHMVGVGMLAGIGFTMSLFLTGIAFADPGRVALAKVGILTASMLSGLGGYVFLRWIMPGAR